MYLQIILSFFIGFITLLAYLYKNLITVSLDNEYIGNLMDLLNLNWKNVFERFSKALQFKTVSRSIGDVNENDISNFITFIKTNYPNIIKCPWVHFKVIDDLSLLLVCDPISYYQSKITPNRQKPWIIMAHLDVVPVDENDMTEWKYPPFSGHCESFDHVTNKKITDIKELENLPYIYGRGTLDVKHVVMSVFEALEYIIETFNEQDFISQYAKNSDELPRPLYIIFGHDEEVGGLNGALKIAEMFKQEMVINDKSGKPFAFILDEGTQIFADLPIKAQSDGSPRPVAFVSVSEKTTARFSLSLNMNEVENAQTEKKMPNVSHSSIPPKRTAITQMCEALVRLNAVNYPIITMYKSQPESPDVFDVACKKLAPVMNSTIERLMFANPDWFKWIIMKYYFEPHPILNSCIRTSSCVTILNGGLKDNIVPYRASAILNQRIHPGQTLQEVSRSNVNALANDHIQIKNIFVGEKIPFSRTDTPGFSGIEQAIKEIFGNETIVLPAIFPASTDSKHFIGLADDIYRFSPCFLTLQSGDINRVHGINERISCLNYAQCGTFYHRLMCKFTFPHMDNNQNEQN